MAPTIAAVTTMHIITIPAIAPPLSPCFPDDEMLEVGAAGEEVGAAVSITNAADEAFWKAGASNSCAKVVNCELKVPSLTAAASCD